MEKSQELKLIARAKRGQAEAFRQLVEAHKDRLFPFVWRIVRNYHEAEDICQAAFVKAYESLASYSEKYAFSTWLYTIAYRLCLNGMRRKKPLSGEMDLAQMAGQTEDTAGVVASSEQAAAMKNLVWDAVDKLTTPQKSAVLLFYREGKSCQDIGTVMGIPAVTVKSHLHRAREKLRDALGSTLAADWAGESGIARPA